MLTSPIFGRRPYIPLSHLVTARMLKIGYFMRAEIIWRKGKGAKGSCAWGSWRSPGNPVVRDVHEYCLCFSKGRFDRVVRGEADIAADDFMASTLSVWDFPPERASRVNHPAPSGGAAEALYPALHVSGRARSDPFIGSGSTAVAAVTTGRSWVGYDISPDAVALVSGSVHGFRSPRRIPTVLRPTPPAPSAREILERTSGMPNASSADVRAGFDIFVKIRTSFSLS